MSDQDARRRLSFVTTGELEFSVDDRTGERTIAGSFLAVLNKREIIENGDEVELVVHLSGPVHSR